MSENSGPLRCLVTAGPTREAIDAVRFITNASTGKMGFAIARAAAAAGWTVDLVSGPVSLPEPDEAIVYPVVTAAEMLDQVDALFDVCDILFMAAAPVDLRPLNPSRRKEKKTETSTQLMLEPVEDILATVTSRKKHQFIVGFAAETHNLEEHAREKLYRKKLDLIAANRVNEPGSGFGAEDNTLYVYDDGGLVKQLGPANKEEVARLLIHLAASRMPNCRD